MSQSHFFVDTLKDAFCDREGGGWYVLKDPFNFEEKRVRFPTNQIARVQTPKSSLSDEEDQLLALPPKK